ncbi:flavin-dependent L-tryptophan oxidase RebO precursor [Komagataeibacter europaeus]|uniref:Tryptophan 2-monooxygenase n=1 Tax=Komagataeibacter europaeus TaxID=33995 RepID=A0A0M0EEJ2_KOMEU|nr:flavin monoamine oxidase family protein [Komagataeibacter europaeus]KON63655.1 flavin-dependent L-tryptophan oxidase RebO precursor [Komagataeibacter europaeus]GBQ44898.1 flavin-containing amine oxidase [Komagataeibacter europaeus LMG 18890]
MTDSHPPKTPTRRQLLTRIGTLAGSAALYQAMTTMGHAQGTDFTAPPVLSGARRGTRVLVLGAGLAGMLSAYELRKAGYAVQVLEFQGRSGGRNISLRGGDTVTELGGAVQKVGFASGNYINPGPWRIPYHHQGLLHYCREFGVELEPFVELNHNSWLHSSTAFDGKPVRYREFSSDFTGFTTELLGKAIDQHKLDDVVDADEREHLRTAMEQWGGLDPDLTYRKGDTSSQRRGYTRPQGGGIDGAPIPSDPFARRDVLRSGLWTWMAFHERLEMQTTMFQPVGGMDMIGKGFNRQVHDLITLNCKVTSIQQDEHGVRVMYDDMNHGGVARQAQAEYCVCTIPLSILSQMDVQVSAPLKAAIMAVPYASSVKMGMEFRRRFWEEDDQIYGGISFTDQPISQISYPSHGYFSRGPAVLLGGYMFGPAAFDFAGMTPQARLEQALAQGEVLHPGTYRKEFSNGVSLAWSRVPWALGCCSMWSEQARKTHYKTLCTMDNRIVLAGEHASYVGCWQEGAILSALDAVTQLHKRAQGAS